MKRMLAVALGTMLLLGIAASSLQADAVVVVGSAADRELCRKKLDQMAVLVDALSVGKSRLIIKPSVSADPTGRPLRNVDDKGCSFITVHPVTTPVNARLTIESADNALLRQYGRVLGAAEVIAPVGGPEDKEKAEPDVYLLFVPINGPISSEMPLWLVSLTVTDDGKVTYRTAARSTVKLTRGETDPDVRLPAVNAAIDFLTATVSMAWKEQTYGFTLSMDICYM